MWPGIQGFLHRLPADFSRLFDCCSLAQSTHWSNRQGLVCACSWRNRKPETEGSRSGWGGHSQLNGTRWVGCERLRGQPSPHPTVPQSHLTSQLFVFYCHDPTFIHSASTYHHLQEAGFLLSTRDRQMDMIKAQFWCLSHFSL